MTGQFSSDAEAVIERKLDVEVEKRKSVEDISSYYELSRCNEWIKQGRFKKVALQFPDHLLVDSVSIVTALRQQNEDCKLYILGDTSYGCCCVDEVAAEHVSADAIIHFGTACLTVTNRIPVLYIFGKEAIDRDDCMASFKSIFPDKFTHIIVMYDVTYSHVIESFYEMLMKDYVNTVKSSLVIPGWQRGSHRADKNSSITGVKCGLCEDDKEAEATREQEAVVPSLPQDRSDKLLQECKMGRRYTLSAPIEKYSIFYIGCESRTLNNLIISYQSCQCYSYNPYTKKCRKESVNVNKSLGRRYYLMQKAKAATTVGILVGTLATAGYREIIDRLKTLLTSAGKKFYLIAMGKLNVAKMANFMEVDVYVLVACPESSIVDSQDFYKPVVTPFEMELACSSKEWGMDYSTDYQDLLPGGVLHNPLEDIKKKDNDVPEFSLITGHMHTRNTNVESSVEGQIVQRSEKLQLTTYSPAAEFLQSRSWQGLQQKLGETPVSEAVEGRHGTASAYSHESNI